MRYLTVSEVLDIYRRVMEQSRGYGVFFAFQRP